MFLLFGVCVWQVNRGDVSQNRTDSAWRVVPSALPKHTRTDTYAAQTQKHATCHHTSSWRSPNPSAVVWLRMIMHVGLSVSTIGLFTFILLLCPVWSVYLALFAHLGKINSRSRAPFHFWLWGTSLETYHVLVRNVYECIYVLVYICVQLKHNNQYNTHIKVILYYGVSYFALTIDY